MSLEISDVTLTFPDGQGRVTALDQVSLAVPDGSVTGVIGQSGSGKSSLLAVAGTLIRPQSGSVRLNGIELVGQRRGELSAVRRHHVGFVFQQANLLPSLTALEQLLVVAAMDGRPTGQARRRAGELLDSVGLSAESGRRPHQLSGGQRQRVNVARALMNQPALLLVDEPTSALDSARSAQIVRLIVDLAHQHRAATLLVTHDESQLPAMDAVVSMRDGRLTAERAPAERGPAEPAPAQLATSRPA